MRWLHRIVSGVVVPTTMLCVALAQPSITSFSPALGLPGTQVTFEGANFSRTLSDNIVYFGAVRASVVNVTGNRRRLTAVVPAGATYAPVTITVGSLTASSWLPFRPTSTSPVDISYAVPKTLGPGRNVLAADLNLDGKIDIVAPVVDTNRLDYLGAFRNIRTGSDSIVFAPVGRSPLGIGLGPLGLAQGDLDGDGLLDVVVTSEDVGHRYVSVFRNTSTTASVQFSRVLELSTVGKSSDVAIADLNDDGRPDLICAVGDSNAVLIFPNTTSGSGPISFGTPIRLATQGNVAGIAVGDLNADGFGDIVVTEQTLNRIAVFRNLGGQFSFAAKVVFSMGVLPDKVSLADFDGDERMDISVSNAGNEKSVTVRLNTTTSTSNITLAGAVSFPAGGAGIASVTVGDANADGRPDIVVPNQLVDSTSVLVNTSPSQGNVMFAGPVSFHVGSGPYRVAVADYDGDGTPDLAVAGNGPDYRFSQTAVLRHAGIAAFAADKSSMQFSVPVDSAQTDSVTVTNTGTDTLRVSSASVSNTRFQVTPLAAVVAPGGSRRFYVTFRPQQDTTLQRDTLRFAHNAAGSPSRVALSGRGFIRAEALFTLNRTSLTYLVPVDSVQTDSVIVTNTGTDSLRITSALVSNTRFQVAPPTAIVAPGGARTFYVTFRPQRDTTLQRDTLRFVHNAAGSPSLVSLSGKGFIRPAALFSINTTSLTFLVPLGSAQTDSVVVTNTGTDTLRITSALVSNAKFQVVPQTAVVAPGGLRKFYVTFRPQQDTTLQRDTLRFAHNAVGSPSLVVLAGKGTAQPAALFSVNKDSLNLSTPVGTARTDSVTVTNTGTDSLRIQSAGVTNTRFQVLPSAAVIGQGTSQTFRVRFSPGLDTTLHIDTIRFVDNASGSPHHIPVSGRGLAAVPSLDRNVLTFSVPLNRLASESLTVTNTGTDTLRIASVQHTNPRFEFSPVTGQIPPSSQRNFVVTFRPEQDTTLQRDTVRIFHNALLSPSLVVLSGRGLAPFFATNTGSLLFYAQLDSSRTDSIEVSNIGRDTLRITSIANINPHFTAFPITAIMLPGERRFFSVRFSPQQDTSVQRDTLRILHNAAGSPATIPVTGRGIPPLSPSFQTDSMTLAFGNVVIGSYRELSVRVLNGGTGVLRVDSIRTSQPMFLVTSADSATIPPAQSTQFTVRFTPAGVGAKNGIIRYYHNAFERRDSMAVRGTGRLPSPASLRVVDSTSFAGELELRWDRIPVAEGFLRYRIYGGILPGTLLPLDSTARGQIDSISKKLSGLHVGVTYTFAVVAVDTTANESQLSESVVVHVPVWAPVAVTAGSSIDPFTQRALLRGTVNPMRANTFAWFEYDSVSLPAASARTTSQHAVGDGLLPVDVEDSTLTLSTNTRYYFRLVARNGFDSVAYGAVDSLFVPGGPAPPAAPDLRNPPDNVFVSSVQMQFSWSHPSGAERYHLQVALDTLFSPGSTFFVINDSTLSDSTGFLRSVAAATTYYWRVGAKNSATAVAQFSSIRRFTAETMRAVQSPAMVFPSEPRSESDYRLVSVPGSGATVADLIAGAGPAEGVDWRIFRDTGTPDTVGKRHLLPLGPLTALTPGSGYWLIRKGPLSVSRLVALPGLSADGTVGILLQEGYNIIGNPFEVPVMWDAVRAANPFAANTRISGFGGQGYVTADRLEPFHGYYMFRRPGDPDVMKIPYPFSQPTIAPASDRFVWRMAIEYNAGGVVDDQNFVGISPRASTTWDSLENHKPPALFTRGSLLFPRPGWDSAYSAFSDDYRPQLGDGQVWDFEVHNAQQEEGSIVIHGIDGLPASLSVQLINRENTLPFDLRVNNTYRFRPARERSQFSLIVGTPDFFEQALSAMLPRNFSLGQNFPNPCNPSTSIVYTIPKASHVRLDVFSVLGQHIRSLVNAEQNPALYTLRWNADDDRGVHVASGVYFYRLIVDGRLLAVKKMVLAR